MAELESIFARVLAIQDNYSTCIENNSDGNPIYVGDAEPGSSVLEKFWRIKKITYDVDGNPIAIQWAEGSRAFKFIWDSRADYTYS